MFCRGQNHLLVVIEACRTPKRTEVAGTSSHVADHHRMWLPGTKGTTNGSGPYPVNFFPETIATFFGGQKLHRNPPCCGRENFRATRDFQRGNVPRAPCRKSTEKDIDAVLRDAWWGFQREFLCASTCVDSGAAILLWRGAWCCARRATIAGFSRGNPPWRPRSHSEPSPRVRRSVAVEPAREVGFALRREALQQRGGCIDDD